MKIRVVHCGTGNIGREALRGILHHPDLELVGHYVNSPSKIGIDSGTLIGEAPTGIIATNNWDELLDLNADCLSYFGDCMGRELEAVTDICRFLERGTNAVTLSVFPWAHPASCPPQFRDPVDAACSKGNSTAYFTGIDPGFATTDLAIAALAFADEVDCVRVTELGWWGDYTAEYVCREYFGFGQKPGFKPLLVTGGFMRQMWAPTLHEIADALGVKIDDWKELYETDSLDHDIETGFGTVHARTAAAVHFELQAFSGGRPIAIVEHNDLVGRGAGSQWRLPFGPGDVSYRIEIEGNPNYTLELNMDYDPGIKMTAMPPINSIPTVCAATPGLKGPLDIPRYWSRNVRRTVN
ncbi:MAG: dihydrodipicolinate reductase [Verrucomicrobiaceae bacterium]|nr:dihydrodipicolinate reductase [Verrucomicrobiaceae bacterium]